MFGEIGAWMYKTLGGIKPDESTPGFKHFFLQPSFVSGLDHFEAHYAGPSGNVISSWKRSGQRIAYHIVVPANSSATITFPIGKTVYEGKAIVNTVKSVKVVAGMHNYVIE